MFSKFSPITFVLYLIIIPITQLRKLTHFDLTPHYHYLILYTSTPDHHPIKINFKINFNLSSIFIHQQYQHLPIYLNQYLLNNITQKIKIFNHKKYHQITQQDNIGDTQQYKGIVGFKTNSDFYQIIRDILNLHHFKIIFKIHQNKIQILQQKCNPTLNFPLQIQMQSSTHTQLIQIKYLSLDFIPKSYKILKLFGKNQNPFSITTQQMQNTINLLFFNQVQTINIKTLLLKNCYKINKSNSFQCDIYKSTNESIQDNLGILLFQFNPIICPYQSGIQLLIKKTQTNNQNYYWLHVFMIIINTIIILLFKYRFMAIKKTTTAFTFGKHFRNH